MTQNTSPVLAGVQTIFAVPRNLWLAAPGSVGGEYRKTEAHVPCCLSMQAPGQGLRRRRSGGGVTGKPVFHWLLKPFILKAPKKLVFGSYGSGCFTHWPSLFLECPSLPRTPPIFPVCLCSAYQISASLCFPVGEEAFPAPTRGRGLRSGLTTHQSRNPLEQGLCHLLRGWRPNVAHRQCWAMNTRSFEGLSQ